MKTPRQVITLELPPNARETVEELRQWNGMTQKELVGRLIGWFGRQDRVLQQLVLGQIPDEIAPDVATVVLRRFADASPGPDARAAAQPSRETPQAFQGLT